LRRVVGAHGCIVELYRDDLRGQAGEALLPWLYKPDSD
jgi:hypothetical protein